MTHYRVNDIYASIQGEGVLTGVPMVLLRLHGCAVGCPFCDTRHTWDVDERNRVNRLEDALGDTAKWVQLSAAEIARTLTAHHRPGPAWVLVTGGEPADQELTALTAALHGAGYKVALETSGTATGHMAAGIDWVCVSPKIDMPGGKAIVPAVVAAADEIKMVIGREADIDKVEELLRTCEVDTDRTTICLQPMSQSKRATDVCVTAALRRGWRLSLQTHKLLALR